MSEIPTYPNDEEYDQARDSAIASAARREERARLRQMSEDIIRDVASLVRLPTTLFTNGHELIDRELVITIAMRLKELADGLIESETP